MIQRSQSILFLLIAATALQSAGGTDDKSPAPPAAGTAGSDSVTGPDWLTGQGISIGGILFPHLHFNAAYGRTSNENGHEFAAGHHDPVTDGWTIQGFEAGLTARIAEHFEAFGVIHIFEDAETNDWDHEFEEWFGKVKGLPGGFEVRGGRYLNRFGQLNAMHQHGWDFVDNNLVNGRFLGDHGLSSIGGELTWTFEPASQWTSVLSVSAGEAQSEDYEDEHAHAHEEAEAHDASPPIEAEGALFDSTVITADWANVYQHNDFHRCRFGLSGAWGDNAWDRTTQVYGLNAEYQWRENGLEPGGWWFRWRTEMMLRDVDAISGHPHDDEGHHAEEHGHDHGGHHDDEEPRDSSFREFGLASSVLFGMPTGFAGPVEFALRGEYVEGVLDAGLPERFRISPAVRLYVNNARTAHFGVQYNRDELSPGGSEDSVWLSFGLNWGGAEVR